MADTTGCINRIVINNLTRNNVETGEVWTIDSAITREYAIGDSAIEACRVVGQIISYLIGNNANLAGGGTLKESNYEPGKLQILRDAQKDNQASLNELIAQLNKIKSALTDVE